MSNGTGTRLSTTEILFIVLGALAIITGFIVFSSSDNKYSWTYIVTSILFCCIIVFGILTFDHLKNFYWIFFSISLITLAYLFYLNYSLITNNRENFTQTLSEKTAKIEELSSRIDRYQNLTDSLKIQITILKDDNKYSKQIYLVDSIRSLNSIFKLKPKFSESEIGIIIAEFSAFTPNQQHLVCECNNILEVALTKELASSSLRNKVITILSNNSIGTLKNQKLEAQKYGDDFNARMVIWGTAQFYDPQNPKYGAEITLNMVFPEPPLENILIEVKKEEVNWEFRKITFKTKNILEPFKKGCDLIDYIIETNHLILSNNYEDWIKAANIFEELINKTSWSDNDLEVKKAYIKQKIHLNLRVAESLRYKPYVTKDQIELHIKRARVALKSESLKDTGFEFASLGRIKVVNDSIQQSIEFFNKAIEKEYEISDYHIRLARAYGSMKQAAKAKSILNEYIQWVEKNRSEYKDYLLKRVRDEITRY
jgi:hypothetical protein